MSLCKLIPMKPITILALVLLYATDLSVASLAVAQTQKDSSLEQPKDVISAQLRKQGHTCANPKNAKRDSEASTPHEAVWTIECENAKFRVKLVPDMAAEITKLD